MVEGDEIVSESSGEAEETVDDVTPIRMTASHDSIDVEAINASGGRNRKLPPWMEDYASSDGEGLSEEEDVVNIALVVSIDLVSLEEAVMSLK